MLVHLVPMRFLLRSKGALLCGLASLNVAPADSTIEDTCQYRKQKSNQPYIGMEVCHVVRPVTPVSFEERGELCKILRASGSGGNPGVLFLESC